MVLLCLHFDISRQKYDLGRYILAWLKYKYSLPLLELNYKLLNLTHLEIIAEYFMIWFEGMAEFINKILCDVQWWQICAVQEMEHLVTLKHKIKLYHL